MPKYDWRSELTDGETLRMERYDQQITMQTAAVEANPDNQDLMATLVYLKYQRYLLQSKVAARLKRRKPNVKSPRTLVAA
jgi:hypothetical protein